MNRRFLSMGLRGTAILAVAMATVLAALGVSAEHVGAVNSTHVIPNNTPGFIKKAADLGATDPSTQITVTVWLQLQNQGQLDQQVAQQNQKGSGQYHKWLTQDQFNAAYAPTSQEVNSVQNFLTAHGLSVVAVAENNVYVKVQGSVAAVEKAFHVQIDNFGLQGVTYRSNTADPSINDLSGAHVAGITGMDDYGYQPNLTQQIEPDGTPTQPVAIGSHPNGLFFEGQCFRGVQTKTFKDSSTSTTATYTGNRYGADITNNKLGHLPPCGYSPSEIQTAYNMAPLYSQGLTGAGQTIVITDAFGSSTIRQDAEVFSQVYGLPDLTSSNFQVLRAPGAVNSTVCNPHGLCATNWDLETTLDVEWAHAMAPGANIDLVIAGNNSSDLDEAINYAVVHHLGNVISNSWGGPEDLGNPARLDRVNRILEQAAAEGIDVNFSSGDCGDESVQIPGCAGFKTVDFPASSPFATGIGGTSLALNSDNTIAFQTGWGNNLTRVANRVSEGSTPVNPPLHLGFQGGAGGGASLTFARPAFQSGVSFPGTTRLVPDASMVSDPFTGAEYIQTVNGQLSVGVIGGTSLGVQMFGGIMAVATQKAGHPLGQAAPLLYNLPGGAVTDVGAFSSPNNVTGSITTPSGTTNYSADDLAAPLDGVTQYYSALYNSPFSTRWFDITFGTDSSLITGPGWDDVTGVGTPNGANFVNALAP
jgi:subtilase family serine protease